MRGAFLCAFLTLALAGVLPTPASAHTQFVLVGYAFDGSQVYDVSVSRTFDPGPDCIEEVPGPEGEVGCMRWYVIIQEFGFGDYLITHLFLGEDSWVPPDVNAGYVGEYHAASLAPDVAFALDGYQTSEFVTATGHYQGFDLVVSFPPTFI